MKTEILNLPHGYTAEISTDECADNPWKAWDGEPPIMVFYDRSVSDYGTGLCIRSIFDALPLSAFEDGAEKVMSVMGLALSDIEGGMPWDSAGPYCAEDMLSAIRDCLPESPGGWRSAGEYFTTCGDLCKLAGIEYLNAQSNGYSQGDSAKVFLAATPEWMELTGVKPENAPAALQGALDTYSAWAWGDVYCVDSILRPDGEELDQGACGGFYGSNHEKSGIMEHCLNYVESDIAYLAKESAEAHRAACADIVTV